MFKKIIAIGLFTVATIAGLVYAAPHGGHGGHGLQLPIPTVSVNLGGLTSLLSDPPIPIVKVPNILPNIQLPNLGIPIPFISLPISGGHGHGGHPLQLPDLPIGDLLNTIIGGNHDHWGDSWA